MTWHIARIDPAHLYRVRRDLDGLAEVYCPVVRFARKVRHRVVSSQRPLMLDYVFVGCAPSPEAWRAIRRTRGVVELLTGAGEPANGVPWECPAEVVETIRAHEAAGEYDLARRYFDAQLRDKLRRRELRGRKFRLSDLPQVMDMMASQPAG